MNLRITFILVIVLIVVGGTVWVAQSRSSPEPKEGKPWLWKVGLEDITHITATHRGETVSYALKGDQWIIEDGNDTPVFEDKWSGMILILSGPQPDRTLSETVEDLGQYGLDPPQTVVQITDRSGQVVEFQLGDPTPNRQHQYIRLSDGSLSTIARVWGDVVTRLVTNPPYPPS